MTVEKTNSSDISYGIKFKSVEASDAGLYKIIASNKCGSATSNECSLEVTGGACIIRKPSDQVFVVEKKTVKIDFEVAGIPLPDVQW